MKNICFRLLVILLVVVSVAGSSLHRDCLAVETISSVWEVVDVGAGMKPALDIDDSDNIHVMAFTSSSSDVLYDSASSINGPWNLQSVASGNFYAPGDLVVDPNGTAHMAFHNHVDGGNPNHVTVSSTGTVGDLPIVSPGHNGWDNALAVDSTGVVHQSSINPYGFGAADGLEYGKFNGSDWPGYASIVGTGQVMYGFNTGLDTDSSNYAHMVYSRATAATGIGDLNYVQDTAGGFLISTIVDNGISRFASLVVDTQDRPHVAWLEVEVDPNDTATGSVMYGLLDGGSWVFETVDPSIANLNIASGRKQVSLVLDDNDQPRVAYGEQRSINYATKTGGVWNSMTLASSDTDLYNGLVILRLNSLEQPTIAFFNASNLVRLATIDLPGDFDGDGDVDGHDLLKWQRGESPLPLSQSDLDDWQTNYGTTIPLSATTTAVPEPSTAIAALLAMLATLLRRPLYPSLSPNGAVPS